jgi:hypothetical protein
MTINDKVPVVETGNSNFSVVVVVVVVVEENVEIPKVNSPHLMRSNQKL